MNARARELGLDAHQLRQPDRPRRPAQLLDRARPGHAGGHAAAEAALRPHRRHAGGDARVGRAPARGQQPQHLLGRVSVRRRRQDRPHRSRPATCWSARPTAPAVRRWSAWCSASRARRRATRTRSRCCAGGSSGSGACAVLGRRRTAGHGDVEYRDEERDAGRRARGWSLTLRGGERVRRRVDAPDEVEGPLAAGERVGSRDGARRRRAPVRRVALVTAAEVPGSGDRCAVLLVGPRRPLDACSLVLAHPARRRACVILPRCESQRGWSEDDHHRHAQRRDRQDARGAELPPRPPPPRGRADADGRRQGRERRARAEGARASP